MSSQQRPGQDRAVGVLCSYLSQRLGAPIVLESRPDVDKSGPEVARRCDAILVGARQSLAVEHTSVDSYVDQRLVETWFREVMVPLERRLSSRSDHHLEISIEAGAITPGRQWNCLTEEIEAAIIAALPTLSLEQRTQVRPAGLPFPVWLHAEENGGQGQVFVLQEAPDDLECQRADVIARAVKNKKNLLRAYRAAGFRTILLLEGKDGVLANRKLVFNALRPYSAQASPDIDDVYFISTRQGPPCVFWLKEGDRVADKPEPVWPTAPGYPFRPYRVRT